MKERPILFSGPMVRAILEGRKSQTRRAIKAPAAIASIRHWLGTEWYRYDGDGRRDIAINCPYGQPGDRLWVRETFYCDHIFYPDGTPDSVMWREIDGQRVPIPLEEKRAEMLENMYYRADGEPEFEQQEGPIPWRPSIHMPRWASRILREVTGVRVERLQDISERDVEAEGWNVSDPGHGNGGAVWSYPGRTDKTFQSAREAFAFGWGSINGHDSWDANPWVWVIEFRLVESQA